MSERLAVNDKDTTPTHIGLRWDDDLEQWETVCFGRSLSEINARCKHWAGKGVSGIRAFSLSGVDVEQQGQD